MKVITNPIALANEINTIHSLFENGLELLHIRKPDLSAAEMKKFLSEIHPQWGRKLVLHSQHQLASEFGMHQIHFTQITRENTAHEKLQEYNELGFRISTSVHTMESFNNLTEHFTYSFLSPVYPSISKTNYKSNTDLLKSIKSRTNFSTKLVALGGISPKTIRKTIALGFDDVALLGTIWNSNHPIENFILCQQNLDSH